MGTVIVMRTMDSCCVGIWRRPLLCAGWRCCVSCCYWASASLL